MRIHPRYICTSTKQPPPPMELNTLHPDHKPDLHNPPPNYYWQSSTRVELNKAMVKFSLEDIVITKDKKVPMRKKDSFGNWVAGERRYTSLDEILKKVKKPLAKCGLYVEQELVGDLVLTRLNHESGEFIMSGFKLQSMGASDLVNNLQAAGGGLTYIKRYALSAMLAISSDEDEDGAGDGTEDKKGVPAAKGTTGSTPATGKTPPPPKKETEKEKAERERILLDKGIEEVHKCNDEDCLKKTWTKYRALQTHPDFIHHKEKRKQYIITEREKAKKTQEETGLLIAPDDSNTVTS